MKRKALPVLNVEAITALANAATISPEDLRAHLRGRRPKVVRGQNALPAVASPRMNMHASIELSLASLKQYLERHEHVVVMFSGGKDSTATLTFFLWAVLTGRVPRPKSIRVILADTRLELPPLLRAALRLLEEAQEKGEEHGVEVTTHVAMAPLDERILVYMLGKGPPPATNMTMRWCTRLAKGKPAETLLRELQGEDLRDVLILTGMRIGESAVRDAKIATVCSKDGGECGAGLYQRTDTRRNRAVLAPLVHWRACHIWEWNFRWAPAHEFGEWSTRLVAHVYGVDTPDEKDDLEGLDLTARTGCMSCFCVEEDRATARVVKLADWSHLAPVLELKRLWRRLRQHDVRLRQPAGERRADGELVKKQHRIGPITVAARYEALEKVLDVQRRVNDAAARENRLPWGALDILNAEEESRIRELLAANDGRGTWPDGWTGREPLATDPFEEGGQLNFLVEDEDLDSPSLTPSEGASEAPPKPLHHPLPKPLSDPLTKPPTRGPGDPLA